MTIKFPIRYHLVSTCMNSIVQNTHVHTFTHVHGVHVIKSL